LRRRADQPFCQCGADIGVEILNQRDAKAPNKGLNILGPDLGEPAAQTAHCLFDAFLQGGARRREYHGPTSMIEQGHARGAFQFGQVMRRRADRDAERVGRIPYRSATRHCQKYLQPLDRYLRTFHRPHAASI